MTVGIILGIIVVLFGINQVVMLRYVFIFLLSVLSMHAVAQETDSLFAIRKVSGSDRARGGPEGRLNGLNKRREMGAEFHFMSSSSSSGSLDWTFQYFSIFAGSLFWTISIIVALLELHR